MDSMVMPVIFRMVKVLAMLNSKVIIMTVVLEKRKRMEESITKKTKASYVIDLKIAEQSEVTQTMTTEVQNGTTYHNDFATICIYLLIHGESYLNKYEVTNLSLQSTGPTY